MDGGAVERAAALLELGRYDEALAAAGAVLATDPSRAEAHLVAAWSARALHRLPEAWEHARAAAEQRPTDGEPLALMALCDLETGDPARRDRARALGRRAVAVAPHDPTAHVALVHTLLDDPATTVEARAAARRALDLDPRSPLLLTLAAHAELASGRAVVESWDAERARTLLLAALREDPQHVGARTALAHLDAAEARGLSFLRRRTALVREDPTDASGHGAVADWLAGTARQWSVGVGVVGLVVVAALLTADRPGTTGFVRGLGLVALVAVLVRVVSVRAAAGPSVTRQVVPPVGRLELLAPLAVGLLLAIAGWVPPGAGLLTAVVGLGVVVLALARLRRTGERS